MRHKKTDSIKMKSINLRKINIFFALFFFILILGGCISIRWSTKPLSANDKKILSCYDNWTYKNLDSSIHLITLLFQKKSNYDINFYPNLIIGVTQSGDTISVEDKEFTGKLIVGDKIKIDPTIWTKLEKQSYLPLYTIYSHKTANHLICSVKIAYYGQIVKINGQSAKEK